MDFVGQSSKVACDQGMLMLVGPTSVETPILAGKVVRACKRAPPAATYILRVQFGGLRSGWGGTEKRAVALVVLGFGSD